MPSEKSLTINFSDEGTVFVEREPTAVATAPEREIRQLRMSKYWKAEAAKQEEYVALGTCALDRLRGENEVLNARICDFQEVNNYLKLELSKEEGCTVLSRHEINRLRICNAALDSAKQAA